MGEPILTRGHIYIESVPRYSLTTFPVLGYNYHVAHHHGKLLYKFSYNSTFADLHMKCFHIQVLYILRDIKIQLTKENCFQITYLDGIDTNWVVNLSYTVNSNTQVFGGGRQKANCHIQSTPTHKSLLVADKNPTQPIFNAYTSLCAGLILGLRPANERQRYFVTTSLIGWVQA